MVIAGEARSFVGRGTGPFHSLCDSRSCVKESCDTTDNAFRCYPLPVMWSPRSTWQRFASRLRDGMPFSYPVVLRVVRRALVQRTAPLIALWILLVLYPNPLNLGISVYRVFYPDIDPSAVDPPRRLAG
jgi:hypothetical protein